MITTLPAKIIEENQYLDHAILAGYRGSIAHGMYVPNTDPNSIDDIDAMYVIVPSLDHYFGTKQFGSKGTKELKSEEWDIVSYELVKFIRLLAKNNPNVMSLLWLEDKDMYLKISEEGRILIDNRDIFSTKKMYHSFVGYAYGQIKRMTHYKFEGYMGEKRKALVDKFSFDTKNSAHAIRILRMGIEFLNEGVLYVKRDDAEQLLQIKRGEWSLEQVQKEATNLFKKAEEARDKSKLPEAPDLEKVNKLSVYILKNIFIE